MALANPGVFWRIIIGVIAFVAFITLLPPIFRILQFPLTSDILLVLRICVAASVLFYILRGPSIGPIS